MKQVFAKLCSTIMCLMVPYAAAQDTVRIVLSEPLLSLEPCMSSRSDVGRVILQNISETLLTVDPDFNTLEPRLATDWTQLSPTIWQFELRQGVTFSDGSNFSAEDVAHSFMRVMSNTIACELKHRYFSDMNITVKPINEHRIQFITAKPQPILPLLLSALTIVPSSTPIAFTNQPIGTGPYIVEPWQPGTPILLSRRSDYWGPQPQVDKAIYLYESDAEKRANMIQTGAADIAPQLPQDQIKTDNSTDFAYPNSETVYLRLDHFSAPLNDIRVRKALNLAIDRESFIGALVPTAAVVATHIVPPSTLGWNRFLNPWPYDPDQARALLQDARDDGVDVDQEIVLIGRRGNFPNALEINLNLAQMFRNVGLNVRLEMYDIGPWIDYYTKPFAEPRKPQMIMAQHDNSLGDPYFSMIWKYTCDGAQSGLCDPKLDNMIQLAASAVGTERARLWRPVFQYVHETIVADVFLFHMVGFSSIAERLDFTPSIKTNSELPLEEIRFRP
ncbi:ABC transporter substrate-binding protein [Marinomonas ostreistagni]|uniref:ABC transporter substrate-binding protein n=1 Tax=Marinomonas ostreistagni TaxID=359209 RepID=UPI001952822F|nr:ABC transporter substrate-binding protein [Marinomonas ostreistagni]MBM6551535.1 peptide ABC transporter substrate-binding protein [Marinomonas ostreistagni]